MAKFLNLSITVTTLFSILLTGCGSESDSDNTNSSDIGIASSVGTYDLRDYIAPAIDKNSTFLHYQAVGSIENIDRAWVLDYRYPYVMESGKDFYIKGTENNLSYQVNDSLIIEKLPTYSMGILDVQMPRKTDIGKKIKTTTFIHPQGLIFTLNCIFTNFYKSKTFTLLNDNYTFSNVIESVCIDKISFGNEVEESKEVVYYSKDKGKVASFSRECYNENGDIMDYKTENCPSGEKFFWYILDESF